MKKLLFIPFIIGIGISFNGCNIGETSNHTTFPPTPAVIDYNMSIGKVVMATSYGVVAAPSLITYSPGDCIFVYEFTVDYDNQPSLDYYTATNIVKDDVNQGSLEESSSIYLSDYTLPISAADGIQSVFFNGKFFTLAYCKDKNPNFRLIYKNDEPETDGIKNFYLLAQPSSPNSTDVTTPYAFNMFNFIYTQGRDTAVIVSEYAEKVECKYIKAKLKYLSKISDTDDEEPEFTDVNESGKPFEIFVPVNNLY